MCLKSFFQHNINLSYQKLAKIDFKGVFDPLSTKQLFFYKKVIILSDSAKQKKLSIYTLCLFLSVIIVIIIASMADHREDAFQAEIDKASQENVTFENIIVNLTNENDALKNETESLKAKVSEAEASSKIYSIISEALSLSNNGDKDGALAKLSEIDTNALSQEATVIYENAQTIISK